MNQSQELNELFTALAKSQGEMVLAKQSSSNPFFKSKYADLTEIVNSSRPALVKHGLCVSQRILVGDLGNNILSTILGHSSGQWLESTTSINPPKSDIQSMGSYITYLKRYSYAAIVGVATTDDDGEQAMVDDRNKKNDDYVTPEQIEQLQYELKGHSDIAEDMMQKMGLRTLKEMPKNRFMSALNRIREIKSLK